MEGDEWLATGSSGSAATHRDLVRYVETYGIRPVIDRRFDFLDAPAAYKAQGAGGLFGKVVIEVG
ncbi:zinc-binding dehydrogenase [Streptomyces sp. NPDC091282]|uniref:zinc-binding dehydrogenase n=1 Tax=Streptomyces sp. NPDC091282 TaxID=3365986 RepID=UPI00380FC9EB